MFYPTCKQSIIIFSVVWVKAIPVYFLIGGKVKGNLTIAYHSRHIAKATVIGKDISDRRLHLHEKTSLS
jgi:hypothetical protein